MSNTLARWLEDQGKGALTSLMHETRLAWSTVSRAARGERVGFAAAVRISRATNGWVTEESLMGGPDGLQTEPTIANATQQALPRSRAAR